MAPARSKTSKQKTRKSPDAVHSATRPSGRFASLTQPWVLATVLALLTLAVYFPVHTHPFFTMDDDGYVVNNPHLRSDSLGDTIGWAFTSYDLANWHPVTWLSHATDVH